MNPISISTMSILSGDWTISYRTNRPRKGRKNNDEIRSNGTYSYGELQHKAHPAKHVGTFGLGHRGDGISTCGKDDRTVAPCRQRRATRFGHGRAQHVYE